MLWKLRAGLSKETFVSQLQRSRVSSPNGEEDASSSDARASDTALGLLVTCLDRDMEFVWTPKHLDKTGWHRSSSVQIKPLEPTNPFFSANPATIRIGNLDSQSGRRSKRGIVSESPSSERRLSWAASRAQNASQIQGQRLLEFFHNQVFRFITRFSIERYQASDDLESHVRSQHCSFV
jgi:hypothetical protein